jgi:hypothetical protein
MPKKAAPKQWKFRTKVQKMEQWNMHYVGLPAKIFQSMGGKYKLRLKCEIGKKPAFSCGLMPMGNGVAFIMLSKKRMKDLELQGGSSIAVVLRLDTSKYGMDVPAELKEVLKQDPQGKKRFQKLTPGKQRNIIHYISTVSDVEKKVDRAVTLIENLKRLPEGKERFFDLVGKTQVR